jgi:hypothetical protein
MWDMSGPRHRLVGDTSGKGVLKFAFATCVLAIAVASSSPGFRARPLLDRGVSELRNHLPAAFEKIQEGLGG